MGQNHPRASYRLSSSRGAPVGPSLAPQTSLEENLEERRHMSVMRSSRVPWVGTNQLVRRKVFQVASQVGFEVGKLLTVNPDPPLGISKQVNIRASKYTSNERAVYTVKPCQRRSPVGPYPLTQVYYSGYPSGSSTLIGWYRKSLTQNRRGGTGIEPVGRGRWC